MAGNEMDDREALLPGTVLPFSGMTCSVEQEAGRGSNAIVYKGFYFDLLQQEQRHYVLIKELFPFHRKQAIRRNGQGEIVCGPEGTETWELHRKSFEYENRVHLQMLEQHPEMTGGNLNTFVYGGTLYTVLGYGGGRSLEQEAGGGAAKLRPLVLRMLGLLDAVACFHESGFLHLDISPDNILLIGQGEQERVMLIDYNSVYEMGAPGTGPDYYSIKSGYSAPEIRNGQQPSPASDFYSVAAVFFRCLTGAALTPFQASRPAPPEVAGCAGLQDMPETVVSMVRHILYCGLRTLPRSRYQTAVRMRRDMEELLARIDGVGVTHWALWESGRRIARQMIQDNAALVYLEQEEDLFPASVRREDGTVLSAEKAIASLGAQSGGAALLTAAAGMGKTTALLRAAARPQAYTAGQPAVLYLSLYGWQEGNGSFIHERILENLKFRPEQRSFADARHALTQLLQKPLRTQTGERPVLLLLLDGLNEAAGETWPLLEEIRQLSRMPGVSLLVSARSSEPALPFCRMGLAPLPDDEVRAQLSRRGLLMPEAPQMSELLKTPMMLSIFLRTARATQRQLFVQSWEELLRSYFSALLEKELDSLPEDTQERWQMDAAISFVLPAIAGALKKSNGALTDAQLFPAVKQCYRVFTSGLLRRAFPQWIGHSQAIRGEAAGAEEWYGQMVHRLLWRRLGLLVRNERGEYQLAHQLFEDYLVSLHGQNRKRLWRRRRAGIVFATAMVILSVAAGVTVYTRYVRPAPYNDSYAEMVVAYGFAGYAAEGRQYAALRGLLDAAGQGPERYFDELSFYHHSAGTTTAMYAKTADTAVNMLDQMLRTGQVISWSGRPLDEKHYRELIELFGKRDEEYGYLVSVLTYLMENEDAYGLYGETYVALLSELAETDADLSATLYQLVCEPHMAEMDEDQLAAHQALLADAVEQNRHLTSVTDPELLSRTLAVLYGTRSAIRNEIDACGALAAYEFERGVQ